MTRYQPEVLSDDDDDGTMPDNVDRLAQAVVGQWIVGVQENAPRPEGLDWGADTGLALTLSNGKQVFMRDTSDCCAYTHLEKVIKHLDKIDHIITGVGTTEGYTRWHIYADYGDVLELQVGWSPGNPFYYGYGFSIDVVDVAHAPVTDDEVESAIRSIQEGL